MRVTHYARRSLAAAGLALALAGCKNDGASPSAFDPQGTTADVAAAQEAFASGPTASFAAVGGDISLALNGAPLVAGAGAPARCHPPNGRRREPRPQAEHHPPRRKSSARPSSGTRAPIPTLSRTSAVRRRTASASCSTRWIP